MTDHIENSDVDETVATTTPNTRRALLGKTAIAAAAATAVGLAGSRSASAANGEPLDIGEANTGTATTALTGGSSLIVTDGTSEGFNPGTGVQGASVIGRQSVANGYGVIGEHFSTATPGTAGTGVLAISNLGPAIVARGTTADVDAMGSGKVVLSKAAYTGAPTGASLPGTLARDEQGNLWYSPATGTYVLVAGPGAARQFYPISPVRVYDSRLDAPTRGKLVRGQNRTVSLADARSEVTGQVTVANVIPVGATAAVYNLTITETVGELGGFLSMVPGDATALSGSSINWSEANQNIANGGTIKLAADRTVKVFAGGSVDSPTVPATHFVIDVTGYYL